MDRRKAGVTRPEPDERGVITYTHETLRTAPPEELVQQVNLLIKLAATYTTGGADRALCLSVAQLPMGEILRRDQDRQTRSMLDYTKRINNLTWVITAMTGLILIMTAIQLVPIARPMWDDFWKKPAETAAQ
jgi:hypothetical protein